MALAFATKYEGEVINSFGKDPGKQGDGVDFS
jgi:hypothetical protein